MDCWHESPLHTWTCQLECCRILELLLPYLCVLLEIHYDRVPLFCSGRAFIELLRLKVLHSHFKKYLYIDVKDLREIVFNSCLPFLAFRLYSVEPGKCLNDIPSLSLEFYYINKICIPIIFLDICTRVFQINMAILHLKIALF